MNRAILICLSVAIAACSPKPNADPGLKTAFELLQSDTFWTLAFADAFADGGSVTLSFVGADGDIIHLWAQAPFNATSPKRQFFLKRTYNDPKAVEIAPGSPVEQAVIELLGSYQRRSQFTIPDSYAQHFIALLRDRQRPFPNFDEWATPPK